MLHLLAYILCHMFFRKITITGEPYKGKSALWVSNHSNGIVDPTLMLALAPVFLHPLAKATLWKNWVMKFFLGLTQAIPVARTQDIEEMFKGKIADPNWKKMVNEAAFKEAHNVLADGGRILIFPEGVSHDDPFLHPLKTGVARMAIEAVSTTNQNVVIQPVVIDYSEKSEFRSELYIHYCTPIVVTSKDSTVPELMNRILAALSNHYVSFKTWDEKRNWHYMFKIFYGRSPESLEEFHDFVLNNRQNIESDPVLMGKIQTMRCMLQASDLSPCDRCWRKAALNEGKNDYLWFLMFLVRIVTFTFLTVPVTILNTLIWGIPFGMSEFLGNNKKKYNRDVYATMKIAHAMWIFPLWSILVVGTVTVLSEDSLYFIHPILLWWILFLSAPLILLIGFFMSERLNFCSGYFRFGLLKLTFPRGLEEMLVEWKEIAGAVIKKIGGSHGSDNQATGLTITQTAE